MARRASNAPFRALVAAVVVAGAVVGLPYAEAVGPSPAVVMDNGDLGTTATGTWTSSSSGQPYDQDALYSKRGTYSFKPQLPAGSYKVYIYWTRVLPLASHAHVTVRTLSGPKDFVVNQRTGGATWNLLGTFDLDASAYVRFIAQNRYPVCVDAVSFELITAAPASDLPPAAPASFAATGGVGFISLTWTANTEPDLAGYSVYRSTTSGTGYALLAGQLSSTGFTDSSVTLGTRYYYVVTALDGQGNESSLSRETSATAVAPNPVLRSVTLAWDPPAFNVDGTPVNDLAGFKIYDGSQSGLYTSVTDIGSATQFTLSDLPVGDYYLVVTAYDHAGNESGVSNEVFCHLQ